VSNQEISVSLAGSLNLGAIFTGAISNNEVGYWLDAMAYSDRYEETPAPNGLVLASRFGFGLRIMLRVRKINPKATLNYGLIGAAVDAGFAQASYEIDSFGLGQQALPLILGGIAQAGPSLTSDTFYKLNTSILKNLVTYINANLTSLQPVRVAALVRSALEADSLDRSEAVLFAMREIRSGKTLHDALANAGDLDSSTIRLTYANILGDSSETIQPTTINQQQADEWLADN
jgi:hypothetical protein